jgi:CRISPR-associated protein Csm4
MQTWKISLRPLAAFGTPLVGDTLFGQLCWALRLRRGEAGLTDLLAGYTEGRPFLVVSDAFPAGLLPRPSLPEALLGRVFDVKNRKEDKRKTWLPAEHVGLPLVAWLDKVTAQDDKARARADVLTQNTINRLTGTTGTGQFAPRQVDRTVYPAGSLLDLYCVLDETRLDEAALREALADIGASGYGRDASTGLGKFEIAAMARHDWPASADLQHAITLAPCAPAPEALRAHECFYQPLTRFGRHGGQAALGGQNGPFKRPILLMKTGAFLSFTAPAVPAFHGTGLGGAAQIISGLIPETVHQGYAPLLPVPATLMEQVA